jgi:hypothetical protein
MNITPRSFTLWYLFSVASLIGCREGAPSSERANGSVSATSENRIQPEELRDIATPDTEEREVDGILIVGSALTNDHVAAIRRITDPLAPKDAADMIRIIQHEGPNSVRNVWEGTHFMIYQSLVLRNGKWQIDGGGGGFGS